MDRRCFIATAATALAASSTQADEPVRDIAFVQDFDELWRTLNQRYGFFGEKATDWAHVRRLHRPMAAAAPSREALVEVLRRVLNELYDPHTRLAEAALGAPRWPPFDLVVEPSRAGARITDVREGSVAALLGLQPGDEVLAADGEPVAEAARRHRPQCLARPDPAAELHALNTAVAGRRGQGRLLRVARAGRERTITLPPLGAEAEPDVSWRRLPEGFGLIRIAGFGEPAVVERFDAALAELRDAPGLILDVRRNGGGDTAVARPLMGRFTAERRVYARMRRREGAGLGPAWSEYVDPRGPFTYTRPVVVLTDRWSASLAEGFPMGLRAVAGATVVGRPGQGLGAAVFPLRLDRTGLQAQYSAEPVYDPADRPRWTLQPDVTVAPGADILAAGVAELRRRIAGQAAGAGRS